jgi:hypothetical protein
MTLQEKCWQEFNSLQFLKNEDSQDVQWNVWLQPSTCKMQEYRRQSGADQEA